MTRTKGKTPRKFLGGWTASQRAGFRKMETEMLAAKQAEEDRLWNDAVEACAKLVAGSGMWTSPVGYRDRDLLQEIRTLKRKRREKGK